jgi:hypothetical protein
MFLIEKKDLKYSYSWNEHEQNRLKHDHFSMTTKSDGFNRRDGNEMVQFINYYCKIHGFNVKSLAFIVELFINEAMPNEIKSRTEIM